MRRRGTPGTCGACRRHVHQRQQDAGDDLQQQQHKARAAEDVPPARRPARHRMLDRLLDEALELHTALYPIVGLLLPGPGRISLTSLASLASVGICPALIISLLPSTR